MVSRSTLGDGDTRAVDVVYRRTDEDRVRDEHGELTRGRGSCSPARGWRGRIGLVNAFGNGVADDKLVHSHVEDFVRFYLEEEPLVALRADPARSTTPEPGATRSSASPARDQAPPRPRRHRGGDRLTRR